MRGLEPVQALNIQLCGFGHKQIQGRIVVCTCEQQVELQLQHYESSAYVSPSKIPSEKSRNARLRVVEGTTVAGGTARNRRFVATTLNDF